MAYKSVLDGPAFKGAVLSAAREAVAKGDSSFARKDAVDAMLASTTVALRLMEHALHEREDDHAREVQTLKAQNALGAEAVRLMAIRIEALESRLG